MIGSMTPNGNITQHHRMALIIGEKKFWYSTEAFLTSKSNLNIANAMGIPIPIPKNRVFAISFEINSPKGMKSPAGTTTPSVTI